MKNIAIAVAVVLLGSAAVANAQQSTGSSQPAQNSASASTDQSVPEPARPRVKRRSAFFGLPLLGLLAAGAAGTALATAGGNTSPQ